VRAVWDYTVVEVEQMSLASAADRDALLCFCEAVVAHRKASVLLARSDVLIKGHPRQPGPQSGFAGVARRRAGVRAHAERAGADRGEGG
jgi:hypothetical protein